MNRLTQCSDLDRDNTKIEEGAKNEEEEEEEKMKRKRKKRKKVSGMNMNMKKKRKIKKRKKVSGMNMNMKKKRKIKKKGIEEEEEGKENKEEKKQEKEKLLAIEFIYPSDFFIIVASLQNFPSFTDTFTDTAFRRSRKLFLFI